VSESAFSLRPLGPQDGPAYAAVLAASPDTGRIATAARFEIDAYQALMSLHRDTAGVVAEAPGYDGFAGSGLIRFDQCQWEGEVRSSALLNSLVVHPYFRRRGLASQLARWREEFARRRIGEGGVIWAIIQRNNTGSERTACKWAPQFLGRRVTIVPLRMRSAPPRRAVHLDVRPALPDDLEEVAEHLNRSYRDYNLYSPETKSSLAAWLAETPFDSPFRHYRVVTDGAGSLLGGMGLAENFRLRTTLITHLPFVLRIPNQVFHVVPADGRLREVALSRIWYAPGRLDAMRHLLETLRWEWRARATSMVLYTDVRGQLMRLLGLPERIGRTTVGIAAQAPVLCAEDRLIYYA
jgi:ribosomal protein S18 acetylase RimI-like enzyme